jgi:hypothetical protein
METEKLDPETVTLEYLGEYGNTRENDLLKFIERECHLSSRGSKKVLARLEDRRKIFRVVHVKLRPPAVYFSAEPYIPLEIQKELIRAQAEVKSAELGAIDQSGVSQ